MTTTLDILPLLNSLVPALWCIAFLCIAVAILWATSEADDPWQYSLGEGGH